MGGTFFLAQNKAQLNDEKSPLGRKDAPQEPLLLEMFEYGEQNGSWVLAAQPVGFAIIVD